MLPCLYIGVTFATLKTEKYSPVERDWLNMCASNSSADDGRYRKSLVGNSSTPQLFLGLIPEIILTSQAFVGVKKKEEEILEELDLDF